MNAHRTKDSLDLIAERPWELLIFIAVWVGAWWLLSRMMKPGLKHEADFLWGLRVRIEQPPPAIVERQQIHHSDEGQRRAIQDSEVGQRIQGLRAVGGEVEEADE